MPDPLHKLISDTLLYLKDPLLPKQTLFASADESVFFKKSASPIPKVVIEKTEPPMPKTMPAAPMAKSVETLKPNPPAPAQPTPQKRSPPPPVQQDAVIEQPKKAQEVPSTLNELSPIKKTLLRVAPHIKLTDEVPDDAVAKRVATAWKEKVEGAEVILLACTTDTETLEFLKTLGKAVDQNLGKAKILPAERLEKENRWDLFLQKNEFRLIIASDGMQKLPELMRFYKAIPAQSQFFLDKTPLVALSPASTYKSIEHKAALWKTLCQYLT